MNLSEKHKRLARWLGFPLLALVSFVMVMHWTFPYERIKARIIDELSAKYDVSILAVHPKLLPGGVTLELVSLRTRPTAEGEVPTTVVIDELELDVGLLALIFGDYEVDVVARVAGGSIAGRVNASGSGLAAEFATEDLPLGKIPGLKSAVGLPMEGSLDAKFSLTLPQNRWRDAEGSLLISCGSCFVGDGETKITPRGRSSRARVSASRLEFAKGGITVPRLALGNLQGEVEIRKGVGQVKKFASNSIDGAMEIDGDIRFSDPFKNSTFPGCMRFRLSDELKKREPNFGNIMTLMGVAPDSNGFANMRMKGRLNELRWIPAKTCESGGNSGRGRTSRSSTRPRRPRVSSVPKVPPPLAPKLNVKPSPTDDSKPAIRPPMPDEPAGSTEPRELTGPRTSGPRLSNIEEDKIGDVRRSDNTAAGAIANRGTGDDVSVAPTRDDEADDEDENEEDDAADVDEGREGANEGADDDEEEDHRRGADEYER